MKNKGLVELVKACKEVLKVSNEHSYLWGESSLWGENKSRAITLFSGFIAQDEYYSFNIIKHQDLLGFRASDWCENELLRNPLDAAKIIQTHGVNAKQIKENFYGQLKGPLGKYLANKYIEEKIK